jgi:hypothetical protein
MPRPGPRRPLIGVKISDEGRQHLQRLADVETDGNLSEMIRKLLSEAVAARQARK